MQFPVDSKILAFALLNSLPKTLDWSSFMSSIVNTTDSSKLTLDNIEVQVTSEHARQSLSDTPDSALKAKATRAGSEKWCDHHQFSGHDLKDCIAYNKWVMALRQGGGTANGKFKKKDKVNLAEGEPSRTEIASMITPTVSQALYTHICAYLSSEPAESKGNQIVIDSGATSHMTPQR